MEAMRNIYASIVLVAIVGCGGKSASKADAPNSGDGSNAGSDGSGGETTVMVTLNNEPTAGSSYSFIAAYQDGSGAWQLAPAPSSDAYTLTIHSSSWGFVWTCVPPTGSTNMIKRVELAYFDTSEKTSLTETVPAECSDVAAAKTYALTGTITGAPGGSRSVAYFGDRQGAVTAGAYTIQAPNGTHDVVIVTYPAATAGGDLIAEGAVVSAAAVTVNGAAVTAPALAYAAGVTSDAVTLTGGGTAAVSSVLYTANGTTATFVTQAAAGAGYKTEGLTTSATGDLYLQQVIGAGANAGEIQNWTSTIAAQTYTAPAAVGGATTTVPTTTPYPMLSTTWSAYTGAVGYTWDATQGAVGAQVEWTAVIGAMYAGTTPKFTMPDLSMLTGWNPVLEYTTAGGNGTGTLRAVTSTAGTSDYPANAIPAAGTQRTFASGAFTFTP